jgi:hypothetical protein
MENLKRKKSEVKPKKPWIWFLQRTKKQRRERYKLLKDNGVTTKNAQRVRDWRPSKIRLFIKIRPDKNW